MNEKGLGLTLQKARRTAGLTQQQLCQKSGLSYSTLAKIERGAIKAPSVFTIQEIAKALDLSLDELLGNPTRRIAPRKKAKNGVSFVYFDINGCLVRFFDKAFVNISKDTNKSADLVESLFWQLNDDFCRGEIDMETLNKLFADKLGYPAFDWQDYYLSSIDVIPEMSDLVDWAAKHYDIGLLSNIGPGLIKAMMAKNILPNVRYASIIDSSDHGVIKPEIEIYEIAQEATGLPPQEIMLIDDSRSNLSQPQKLGWQVMWFNGYDAPSASARLRETLSPID